MTVSASKSKWTRHQIAGDGYMASNERVLVFGLGKLEHIDELLVEWPSGGNERFGPMPTNREIVLVEGDARPRSSENQPFSRRYATGTSQTLQKSRRAVGVSPSVHCLGDHFSDRLLISPKVILRTPRANVGHVENRRAYAGRSPLGLQLRGHLGGQERRDGARFGRPLSACRTSARDASIRSCRGPLRVEGNGPPRDGPPVS